MLKYDKIFVNKTMLQNKIVDFFYQWLLKNIRNMMIKLKLLCTSAEHKKILFFPPRFYLQPNC